MKMIEDETQLQGNRLGENSTLMPPSHCPLLRKPSFTDIEAFFLHKLLVDDDILKPQTEVVTEVAANEKHSNEKQANEKKVFDDDVLFTVPPRELLQDNVAPLRSSRVALPDSHKKARRRSTLGLWQGHEQGVTLTPAKLKKRAPITRQPSSFQEAELGELIQRIKEEDAKKAANEDRTMERQESSFLDNDADSEGEVRPEKESDEISTASSWDEEEDKGRFDTWEVLKDEYAADFGFDYNNTSRLSIDNVIRGDHIGNTFKIIGTSSDDVSSHPHVLSPPLMDALTNFLPIDVQGENFWMRYSLVRDGASLETLKEYVRAAPYTLLAIETPSGQVFGSFTSSVWKNHFGFYGGKPAFVWKMRHGRRSKCASLFDQVHLESEIDVYKCQEEENFVQLCRHDGLAVGGDDGFVPVVRAEMDNVANCGVVEELDSRRVPSALENLQEGGFAIALEDDLMCGTTSPSQTFNSPALYGPGDRTQVFDVAGLEVWSFTSCMDVQRAEKLEMTKYFIEESIRGSSRSQQSSSWSSQSLVQERFYRRVGDDFESEERRDRWQYLNMMNPTGGGSRGFGASPRFAN